MSLSQQVETVEMVETALRGDVADINHAVSSIAGTAAPVELGGMVAMEETEDKAATLPLSIALNLHVIRHWIRVGDVVAKLEWPVLEASPAMADVRGMVA